MDKKTNSKVQKVLDVSKSLKGKTLTGQKPNEIQIFTTVTAANGKVASLNNSNLHMHNFDFHKKM